MVENNNVVKCPVCNRTLENMFALKGHLRLTMDHEHLAFRQQQNETVNLTPVLSAIPVAMNYTGVKLIDTLESFIKKQEESYGEETKANEMFKKLKEMVVSEREGEKRYQELIDSEEIRLDQECEKIKAEYENKYNQDFDEAVNQKLNIERGKIKAELEQKYQQKTKEEVAWEKEELIRIHQKEIEKVRSERSLIEYNRGLSKGSLYIYNPLDGNYVFVEPDSTLHDFLNRLVHGAWVSHPDNCLSVFGNYINYLMNKR